MGALVVEMKHLFTKCPVCYSRFYHEFHGVTETNVVCPYCRHRYKDRLDLGGIKESDYYWELYRGLYPPTENNLGNRKHIRMIGYLQIFALPFLLTPLFHYIFHGHILELGTDEYSITLGIVLAGLIFLTVSFAGIFSCVKAYSFAISLTGSIFLLLTAFLVMVLSASDVFLAGVTDWFCYGTMIPIAMASYSLSLILSNKKGFSKGY